MNNIFRIMILLLISSVVACATGRQNINAANDEDQDIGLGGTGMLADAGSGLGGTGIVGEITGFGSIFVNGVEIEYHEGTPFTINGVAAKQPSLQIGDVVEVLTTDASKHTQALRMNQRHEVIGKVTSVDAKASSFIVFGQTVINPVAEKALPPVGETVAVSGIRIDDATVQATRVVSADVNQSLLRKHNELPFSQQAERWLVQTYVQKGQVSVQLDGSAHVISVGDKSGGLLKADSTSRVIQLKKSASGQPVVDRVLEPAVLPRGRQSLIPSQQPGGFMSPVPVPGVSPRPMQRSVPGSMRMNITPEMYRKG